MKKWKILSSVILLALIISGCGMQIAEKSAEKEIKTIRIVTEARADSVAYQQIEDFAAILHEKSEEKFDVRIYKKNEWGKEQFFLDYLKAGSVTMICLTMTEMQKSVPEYGVYREAYLFRSEADAEQYIRDAAKNHVYQFLPSGIRAIGLIPDGFDYYCDGDENGWKAYAELRQLQAQRALGNTTVYDMRAHYLMNVLLTTTEWWENLSESDQKLIQDAYTESLDNIFHNDTEDVLRKNLADIGIAIAVGTKPELENVQWLLREQYFSAHQDRLTEYWHAPVEMETGEGGSRHAG